MLYCIKNLSELTNGSWWNTRHVKDSPKKDELEKTYNRAKKILENLMDKITLYLTNVIVSYGYQTDNTLCDEFRLDMSDNDMDITTIWLKDMTVLVETSCDIEYIFSIPVDRQMSILELVDNRVKNMKKKDKVYVKL